MATFGLVHGAWHGAWCWERLSGELTALGHRAIAMDLPCDDPLAGCMRYSEVVQEHLGDADEVVLVGHSLGGLTIPLVAAARPVKRLVYLCSLIPAPGKTSGDQFATEPDILVEGFANNLPLNGLGSSYWPRDRAAAEMYPDCSAEDAEWAWPQLRPQSGGASAEVCPLRSLPDVETVYVLGRKDRAVNPAWSRRAATARLGVKPIELQSGHSPFITQPRELADLLTKLA